MLEKRIYIKISEADKKIITDCCSKCGLSISDFIRFSALKMVREIENEKEEKNK